MTDSLAGDQQAYQRLLTRVSSMVRGYLMNSMSASTRSAELVEDLVQEVLIAIHRKRHLYRTAMPILPWLFAIARYRLIDHVRAQKRRPSVVEWDETLDPADPNQSAVPDEHSFEVEEALACLSEKQKRILVLAKAEGVPLAEIATRFQMSLSAVKVTVHRALAKVRQNQKKQIS